MELVWLTLFHQLDVEKQPKKEEYGRKLELIERKKVLVPCYPFMQQDEKGILTEFSSQPGQFKAKQLLILKYVI